MRAASIALCLMTASSFKVCGSDGAGPQAAASASAGASLAAEVPAANGAASAQAQVAADATRPEFGGSVLVIGEHRVELLLRADGEVLAFVRTAAGAAVDAESQLELKADVRVSGGATESVALRYDAGRKCFAGRVKAGVELAPGPVELSIAANGKVAVGRFPFVGLRAVAEHGGSVVVAGDYSVELVARGGELAAFVFDASGKASAAANLGLKVALGAPAATTLDLSWVAASASYRAKLAAGSDVELKPIAVTVSAGAKSFIGAAASLRAVAAAHLEPPRLDAHAKLDADANVVGDAQAGVKAAANAKLKAPELKANLAANANKAASAAAGVNITPPKVSIQKSASAGAKAGGGAKASAGFSFGVK